MRTHPGIGLVPRLAVLATLCMALPAGAAVVVNEILYNADPANPDPLRQYEWVELYNSGPGDVDLTGWTLANRDGLGGPGARALPAVLLPADTYLVVHIAAGANDFDFTDGCGAYYTGDPPGTNLFDDLSGECGLYATGGIVDFLAWNRGDAGYVPGNAHNDAVLAGIWTSGAFVNTAAISYDLADMLRGVQPGSSLGRDQDGTDTNQPEDWDSAGGVNALDNNPCRANHDPAYFVEFPETFQRAGNAAWTVMLYMSADNNLEKAAYNQLKSVEHDVHGSDTNVNIVAMMDGKSMTQAGILQPGGNVVPVGPAGVAYRSKLETEGASNYVTVRPVGGVSPNLGEVNMADPQTLKDFITWSKTNFPATHYALILFDHGEGWKAFGADETNTGPHKDYLYMGELATALSDLTGSNKLDLLGFNACLMGMIEVAYQVQPYCKYYVAHEQISWAPPGFPLAVYLPALKSNTGWTGKELGTEIVNDYATYWSTREIANIYTISCIDEAQLPTLVTKVSEAAGQLRAGCDDFQTHDTPADNVEERLRDDAAHALRFTDKNYMDLRDFAQIVEADKIIPDQYKAALRGPSGVIELSKPNGTVVIAEKHSPSYGKHANGLTIYMPGTRTVSSPTGHAGTHDDVYDYPDFSRVTDGSSQRALYAPNNDCLPKLAVDVENSALALAAPAQWPLVTTPSFRFPMDTEWDEFLLRYYHPVADNHILKATGLDCNGKQITIYPKTSKWPTPDEITIYPGFTVYFSAVGSTDADTSSRRPIHWMWDFDDQVSACGGGCIAPYEVPSGTDAASAANDDMNAEHDCDKSPLNDEKEADSRTTSHVFPGEREYVVTLNVWDDNHTFKYHDTKKAGVVVAQGALYVHPQTDDFTSIIHVIPCPQTPQCPPTTPSVPRTTDTALESDRVHHLVVDDVIPQFSSVVTGGCWWGTYSTGGEPCGGLYPDNFTVRYYQDAGGLPGPLMAEFSQSNGTLSVLPAQPTGLLIGNALPEYISTGSHAPLTISAGQCTWVEITNEIPNCTWSWEDGDGGDGLSLQMGSSETQYSLNDIVSGDRALSLTVSGFAPVTCLPQAPPNDECAGAFVLPNGPPIQADNRFATTTTDEPEMSCLPDGGRGVATVWFVFAAESTSARVSTCAPGAPDSVLAVYDGSCEDLTELGSNDDACGAASSVTVTDLAPGQLYFVKLASRDDTARGLHQLQLTMPAPSTLPGDMNCDGVVNNQDIDGFVLALFHPDAYSAQHPECNLLNADLTGDGTVNNQDIDGFVAALFAN